MKLKRNKTPYWFLFRTLKAAYFKIASTKHMQYDILNWTCIVNYVLTFIWDTCWYMAEKGAGAIEKDRDYAFADYNACKRCWWRWCCITTVVCMFTRWNAHMKSFDQFERLTGRSIKRLRHETVVIHVSDGFVHVRARFVFVYDLF